MSEPRFTLTAGLFAVSEAIAFFIAGVAVWNHDYPMAAAFFALACYNRLMRRLP